MEVTHMTKQEFINTLEEYLEKTGMSEGTFNAFFCVSDQRNINSTIFIDDDNYIHLTPEGSINRVKTTININNVIEFRYSQFGEDGGRFFVICNDNSGLDFCEGDIGFFENGCYENFRDAFQYFEKNIVSNE